MKCKNCGKESFDSRLEFCSINCQDDYVHNLEKRLIDAMNADSSYVDKMNYLE